MLFHYFTWGIVEWVKYTYALLWSARVGGYRDSIDIPLLWSEGYTISPCPDKIGPLQLNSLRSISQNQQSGVRDMNLDLQVAIAVSLVH